MSKPVQYCCLFTFSLLLSQTAGFGFLLTGQWLYLLALLLGGTACAGSLLLCLDSRTSPVRVEHHYHLYYDTAPPQRTASRW